MEQTADGALDATDAAAHDDIFEGVEDGQQSQPRHQALDVLDHLRHRLACLHRLGCLQR